MPTREITKVITLLKLVDEKIHNVIDKSFITHDAVQLFIHEHIFTSIHILYMFNHNLYHCCFIFKVRFYHQFFTIITFIRLVLWPYNSFLTIIQRWNKFNVSFTLDISIFKNKQIFSAIVLYDWLWKTFFLPVMIIHIILNVG